MFQSSLAHAARLLHSTASPFAPLSVCGRTSRSLQAVLLVVEMLPAAKQGLSEPASVEALQKLSACSNARLKAPICELIADMDAARLGTDRLTECFAMVKAALTCAATSRLHPADTIPSSANARTEQVHSALRAAVNLIGSAGTDVALGEQQMAERVRMAVQAGLVHAVVKWMVTDGGADIHRSHRAVHVSGLSLQRVHTAATPGRSCNWSCL
jgi:hypothetical protein